MLGFYPREQSSILCAPTTSDCEVAKLVRQEILNLPCAGSSPAFASKLLGGAIPVSQPGFELGLWRFDSFPPSQ